MSSEDRHQNPSPCPSVPLSSCQPVPASPCPSVTLSPSLVVLSPATHRHHEWTDAGTGTWEVTRHVDERGSYVRVNGPRVDGGTLRDVLAGEVIRQHENVKLLLRILGQNKDSLPPEHRKGFEILAGLYGDGLCLVPASELQTIDRVLTRAMDALESDAADEVDTRRAAFEAIQELYEPPSALSRVERTDDEAPVHLQRWEGEELCSTCEGEGDVTEDVAQAGDQTLTETYDCPDCDGTGLLRNDLVAAGPDEYECRTCRGSGITSAHVCDPSQGCGPSSLMCGGVEDCLPGDEF